MTVWLWVLISLWVLVVGLVLAFFRAAGRLLDGREWNEYPEVD